MQPYTKSALVLTEHLEDYQELCNTIHDPTFPWGYNKPSHVLIHISKGCAQVITAITLDSSNRTSWISYMAKKHELELKDPIPLEQFLIQYVAYKLTEDLEVFK